MPYADPEERRKYNQAWYRNNRYSKDPDVRRAEDTAKYKARLVKIRIWVNAFKLKAGCVDCGYKEHPAALDFDHVHGNKVCNISKLRTLKKIKEEIKKCVVRCANCHRIITLNRMQEAQNG